MNFIFNIINPNPEIHNGYIYQIVSNSLNNIDVDKFDYLTRDSTMLGINISFNFNRFIENALVINNIICYPKKIDTDIINLFASRYYMHKKIYTHKLVISSLLIITELLEIMNENLHFIEHLDNIDKFILLTDDYIMNIGRYYSQSNNKLKNIFNRLDKHEFYQMIYSTFIDPTETLSINQQQIINSDTNIIYFENIIGFISEDKKDLFKKVLLYKQKDPYNNLENLLQSDSNRFLPQKYQEKLIILFYKDNSDKQKIEELQNKFIKQI